MQQSHPRLKYFEVISARQEVDFTKIGYTDFEEDREGNIWIATYDLVKFNPKTYDFQEVLDQDVIVSMLIDGRNTICMSTLDEVIFYNDKKRLKYTFAFGSKNQFEIWGNKIYKLQNNKILATNKEMATLINYNDFKAHSFNDQLYIARIQAADSVILINENNLTVRLKTEQNSLSIGYGILMPPNMIMYDYYFQLEGFDQDWQLDKRQSRYAIYGNLDGGDYVFRVKARDVNGKFLPERRVYISIASPFYRAGWFRILSFVLAASLTIAFIVYRADQRKKIHHLQLQSTRLSKDKTEIQYQNLINHLNPHFLFNSLTSLNSLIIAEPKQASKFLQKLSAIYRYILQSKDKETVTLEHELNFVKNYVELQKSRFEEGLQVNIHIDEKYLTNGIVLVTLQNLFENAIKHNIIEDENPLRIEVYVEGGYLIVKNNLQKKKFVETSNKQGLESLKKLYTYLTLKPFATMQTEMDFIVNVPLI